MVSLKLLLILALTIVFAIGLISASESSEREAAIQAAIERLKAQGVTVHYDDNSDEMIG